MEMLSGANSADAVRPVDAGVRAVPQCVAVSMLLPGTLVTVCTRYSRYRLVVIDGCHVLVSGGDLPGQTEAFIVGGGDDGEKTGWIIEGLRLEFWTANTRLVTSAIQTVNVTR